MIALRSLTRYAGAVPVEAGHARCELCGDACGEPHRHVLELEGRAVHCACAACAIAFGGRANPRYRTIPERVRRATDFTLRIRELGIPVSLAICQRDLVCYPGPAGMTDAELDGGAWEAIAAATELAGDLEPDVEALLIRDRACYLVPISTCFELVGRLRAVWEGFTGGARVEAELATFFAELDRRAGRR